MTLGSSGVAESHHLSTIQVKSTCAHPSCVSKGLGETVLTYAHFCSHPMVLVAPVPAPLLTPLINKIRNFVIVAL